MGIKDEIGHAKTLFDKGTDLLRLRLRLLTLDLADQAASTFKIAAALLLAAVLLFAAVLALMFGLNRLLGALYGIVRGGAALHWRCWSAPSPTCRRAKTGSSRTAHPFRGRGRCRRALPARLFGGKITRYGG